MKGGLDIFDNIIYVLMFLCFLIMILGVIKDFIIIILWKYDCYFLVFNKIYTFLSIFSKKFKPFSEEEMKIANLLKKKYTNIQDIKKINNSEYFNKKYNPYYKDLYKILGKDIKNNINENIDKNEIEKKKINSKKKEKTKFKKNR